MSVRQPFHFKRADVTAQNRLIKAALSEQLAVNGIPSRDFVELYRRWGTMGFGIIISGNFMAQNEYLENPYNVVVCEKSRSTLQQVAQGSTLCSRQAKHGVDSPNPQFPKQVEVFCWRS